MKTLKQILFTFAMVAGLAMAVTAQRDDQKKPRPPKDPPPTVNPQEKPPRKDPPREDKKPKKPGMAYLIVIPAKNFDLA